MTKLLRAHLLPLCFCLLILFDVTVAKGGGSRGGGSRSSKGSRGSSSSSSKGSWFSSWFSSGSSKSTGSSTSSGSSTGWQNSNTPAQTSSGTSYLWPNLGTGYTGTNYGWKKPNKQTNTGTSSNTNARQPPPYSPHDSHKPASPPSYTSTNMQHNQRPPAYSVNDPNKSPPPAYSRYDSGKYPSQNIGPGGYPVQNNHIYTGPGHVSSYHSQPNVQSSSYGYSPSNYPSNTQVGYPGGGIYPGSNSYNHQGMGIFGSPSHGYSYPTSNSWGYSNYGSGGYGGSSSKTDVLGGFAAGYATNSLVHSFSRPSNHWGYHSGYGGGYGYNGGYNPARNTYITNNYNYGNDTAVNNEPNPNKLEECIPNKPDDPISNDTDEPEGPCVTYHPVTKKKVYNPRCICEVTETTDIVTNVTKSLRKCKELNYNEMDITKIDTGLLSFGNIQALMEFQDTQLASNYARLRASKEAERKAVKVVVTSSPQTITPMTYQERYAAGSMTESAPLNNIDSKEEDRRAVEEVVTPSTQTISPITYQERYAKGSMAETAPLNNIDNKEEKRNEIFKELEKYLNIGKLSY